MHLIISDNLNVRYAREIDEKIAKQPKKATRSVNFVVSFNGLNEKCTFPNSWSKKESTKPVIASEINNVGTIWSGLYPSKNKIGAIHVPKPIPAAESKVSKINANIIINKISLNIIKSSEKKIEKIHHNDVN